jgi:type I restriction enzyme, R subunit
VQAGQADDTPEQLNTPGLRALYNNLKPANTAAATQKHVAEAPEAYQTAADTALTLAIKLDEVVKRIRPDAWRGIQAKEQVIKQAMYELLQDVAEVERLFLIIKQQSEY